MEVVPGHSKTYIMYLFCLIWSDMLMLQQQMNLPFYLKKKKALTVLYICSVHVTFSLYNVKHVTRTHHRKIHVQSVNSAWLLTETLRSHMHMNFTANILKPWWFKMIYQVKYEKMLIDHICQGFSFCGRSNTGNSHPVLTPVVCSP